MLNSSITMEVFQAVEVFTQIITYIMIISGVPPCLHMWKSGDTRSVPYTYFLAGLFNGLFSVWYGYVAGLIPVFQMNAVASVFNIFYIAAFILTSKSKRQPLSQLSVCATILVAVYLYLTILVPEPEFMDALGKVLVLACTALLLTPLIPVRASVANGDASSISTVMAISGLLCCTSWFVYGLLLKDFNIYASNLIGILSNSCQILCLVVYGTKSKKTEHKD